MALTRLMGRANKRQTRPMTKAAASTKSSQLRPVITSRRPPARKRRVRAAAARRDSDPVPATSPIPTVTPAQDDDDEEAGRTVSPIVPGSASQPLVSAPSSPILEQEQEQQIELAAPSATISQPSYLLQHLQGSTSSPVLKRALLEQFSASSLFASLSASFPTPSFPANIEQRLAQNQESSTQKPTGAKAKASGNLSTLRMVGKFPHRRVIPDKVGPDPSLFASDSENDDPAVPRTINPKPIFTITFREIEGRIKGVLNSAVAAPCSMALTVEIGKETGAEKKAQAELLFLNLRGCSLVMRNAERRR
ncbi:hypothetical protein IFR05_015471 [Cadophora sp. M221]|nr:hypothetical protein IFR05_015471 [Cadophora sp. M221]